MPRATPGATGLEAAVAFPSLQFEDPVALVPETNSTRLYVCERQGRIFFFTNTPAATVRTLFLDISATTQGYEDCGLMAMAFHPEFGRSSSPNRGYIYVYYQFRNAPVVPVCFDGGCRPPNTTLSTNRLSRFTVPDGSLAASAGSEQVLIDQCDRNLWHNGGGLFFGADGFLYLSNGDEGDANDSYGNTQLIDHNLFSGLLRIDVDQRGGVVSHAIRRQPAAGHTANYYIPNDNPWLDAGGTILEEFTAIGLRSPHRATFDSVSGRVWIGDVGQGTREEVNVFHISERGLNFQWAYREGSIAGPKPPPATIRGAEKPPLYDYPHDAGNNCVIGGYVYRGAALPELTGKYIFGDNGSQRIWSLDWDGVIGHAPAVSEIASLPPIVNNYDGLSSFGVDRDGEIYMCKMGRSGSASGLGRIYKLRHTAIINPDAPAQLSLTSAFTDLATLTPVSGLIPYNLNSPLWSDGAHKQRWAGVPTPQTVSFRDTGEWSFPTGTVFVKHFEIVTNELTGARKRLETRFLVQNTNNSYYGVTYKWRANNSDADLLPGGSNETFSVITASGIEPRVWSYPSRSDCLICHNANAKFVLGVKTRQLNCEQTYAVTGRTDNQLRAWNHIGLFTPAIYEPNIPGYARLVAVTNADASFEHRARSYLDANCAQCHRPGGVPANFDARFDTALANQNLINGPVQTDFGIHGAHEITPGSTAQSIAWLRVNSAADGLKMPPLAKNRVDMDAVNALTQWINSLPPSDPLPAPWEQYEIGAVGLTGGASFSAGSWSVTGGGADIFGTADEFHAVARSWTGDGEIIARVVSVQDGVDALAQSGLFFRENLAAGAKHALISITPNNGVRFKARQFTDGTTSLIVLAGPRPPEWLRVRRTGSLFEGFVSADGLTWTFLSSAYIDMGNTVCVGLAATARNDALVQTSVLDNLTVRSLAPPVDIAISAPADGAAFVIPASINITTDVIPNGNPVARVEFLLDGVTQGNDPTAPYTFSMAGVAVGVHTLLARAVTVMGPSFTSPPVRIYVGAFGSVSDSYTVQEDQNLMVLAPGVLANDGGSAASAELITPPTHGTLAFNANGSFNYRPHGDYSGSDQFVYRPRNSGSVAGTPATVSITVTPVNDAPRLVNSGRPHLPPTYVNISYYPGALVRDIIASTLPLDLITDPDAGALEGFAVVGNPSTNGGWYFSTDNGTTWNLIGNTVSESSAVLLAADNTTRLLFYTLSDCPAEASLVVRAWDQTVGVNGSSYNITAPGGTSAFSDNTEVVRVAIRDGRGFRYDDFRDSSALRMLGAAAGTEGRLRLTDTGFTEAGAAWFPTAQSVGEGFTTEFTFQITNIVNTGADGFAFVMQAQGINAIGGAGHYLGYGGLSHEVVVEFDTWDNAALTADPNGNHVAIHASAGVLNPDASNQLASGTTIPNLKDGNPHRVRITYEPTWEYATLYVYIDGQYALQRVLKVNDYLQSGGMAFVGFTAGTGGASENHDILDWWFQPNSSPHYLGFPQDFDLIQRGSASTPVSNLVITPSAGNQAGAAWYPVKQNVARGFTSTFSFQILNPVFGGADGFAFAIQNTDPYFLGAGGGGMGYDGLANSLIVEFDTWDNTETAGDPNGLHVAIHSADTGLNGPRADTWLVRNSLPPVFDDGGVHAAQITYDGAVMTVNLDGTRLMGLGIDLENYLQLDRGKAWVGFVGGTGGAWESHEVLDWNFTPGNLEYRDFAHTEGFAFVGDATGGDGRLYITPSDFTKVGAAWSRFPQVVSEGFITEFDFRFHNPQNTGADGMAFVIQNSSAGLAAIGGGGAGLGYDGIENSVVVEFDTWDNGPPAGDPNGNHIAIHTAGTGVNRALATTQLAVATVAPLDDDLAHHARLDYSTQTGLLRVFVDNLVTPVMQTPINFATLLALNAGRAWVGFTASTGGATEQHEVWNWTFRPQRPPAFLPVFPPGAIENEPFSMIVAASDRDGCESLEFTSLVLPGWLRLRDRGDGTVELSGTPRRDANGANNVTLRVNDGSLSGDVTFVINVTGVPAPVLRLSRVTPGRINICWPYPSTGYFLQASSILPPGPWWSNLGTAPTRIGSDWCLELPAPGASSFYRLTAP